MPVYKDKNMGTWYSSVYYKDWTGNTKRTTKRGFATKKEAVEWEAAFRLKEAGDLDMTFEDFFEIYKREVKPKLRLNSWITKESIVERRIMPYFAKRRMSEIRTIDVINWQNELMNQQDASGKGFSPAYLKTCQAQFSAVFNHAIKYYGLRENPVHKAGGFGTEHEPEMKIWTKEEYLRFSEEIADKQESFVAFEILYWCGIRMGELLALTPSDFDFEKNELHITKSYQKIRGKDVITPPKTPTGIRVISITDFLAEEVKTYINMIYGIEDDQRIFSNMSKGKLHHELDRGCKAAGVKRIRVHDFRHSHVSLLINMGFDAVAIAKRMGHESIRVTYRYAHMFPGEQLKMVERLSREKEEYYDVGEE